MERVAIITGASRGIGAATAILAASRGYAVCVNYLRNEAAARGVVEAIQGAGGKAIAVAADVVEGSRRGAHVRGGGLGARHRHGAREQRRHPRAAGARREHRRRAPRARLRHQRDRLLPVRPRGRAPHVHQPRRPGRGDRERVLRRGAHRLAQRVRGLRGLEGSGGDDDAGAREGSGRGGHPRERGAARAHLHRDPRRRRRAGARRSREGRRADEAGRAAARRSPRRSCGCCPTRRRT